jgi:hypothetical protein
MRRAWTEFLAGKAPEPSEGDEKLSVSSPAPSTSKNGQSVSRPAPSKSKNRLSVSSPAPSKSKNRLSVSSRERSKGAGSGRGNRPTRLDSRQLAGGGQSGGIGMNEMVIRRARYQAARAASYSQTRRVGRPNARAFGQAAPLTDGTNPVLTSD